MIENHDSGKESPFSQLIYGKKDGEDDNEFILEKLVLEGFTRCNQRKYIFFNDRKFVQSRIIIVNLWGLCAENQKDRLANQLLSGIMDVESLMSICDKEICLNTKHPSREMVKQPILKFMEAWEESVETSAGINEEQPCKIPSQMAMYGKADPRNANLTPMEAWIVKQCYLPGHQTSMAHKNWYKEEDLLHYFGAKFPRVPARRYALGWFFNSQHHFQRSLMSAVNRARTFFTKDIETRRMLPPHSGLSQCHIDQIQFRLDIPPGDKATRSEIKRLRKEKNPREAALIGITQTICYDMLMKRMEYIKCCMDARRLSNQQGWGDTPAAIICFSADRGRWVGSDHSIHTYLSFISEYQSLNNSDATGKR